MRRIASIFALAFAAACSGGGGAPDTAAADGADGSDGAVDADVSYYADIQPMLQQHCTRCHSEGGLGPGDFTNPAVVDALAPAMRAAIEDRTMPPAAADPDCQPYRGSDVLTMPDDARETFGAWVDAGKPMGAPEDAPEPPQVSRELEDPDVVFSLPAPYTPAFADTANPGNEYRCFAIDPAEYGGRFITALAPVVDQPALVHHIVLFTVDREGFDDAYRADEGWNCINGEGGDSTQGMIAAWAPGMLPIEFPDGVGMEIPSDQLLIMQMHYFYNGPEADGLADQSGYAMRLSDEAVKPAFMAPLGTYGFAIPPGEADHRAASSFENSFFDLEVLGIFPHMHQLGTSFDARIRHQDGSETCLVTGEYDFDNQMTYQFEEPVPFALGDEVAFECAWDNSEGDSTVRYGERTDEEMCFFFTLVTL